MRRSLIAAFSAVAILSPATAALAQNLGLGPNDGTEKAPVNITADNGIEWRQAEHVYIARGNVKTVRGKVTVYADEMRAYYRPAKGSGTPASAAKPPTTPAPAPPAPAADKKPPPGPLASSAETAGSTEIYRLEAQGHVRFVTDTQTATGEHAVYDVDQALLVMTGDNLKVVTAHDTITARDSFEWYDTKQTGVARGNAVDNHDGKHVAGDILVALLEHPQGQAAHIKRVDAEGHVFVSSQDQIGRGDHGVYNAEAGTVTLSGHVRLTRDNNEMRGEYGVVDLNRNVGHLLPAAPGTPVAGGPRQRVEGLIIPNQKPAPVASSNKPGT